MRSSLGASFLSSPWALAATTACQLTVNLAILDQRCLFLATTAGNLTTSRVWKMQNIPEVRHICRSSLAAWGQLLLRSAAFSSERDLYQPWRNIQMLPTVKWSFPELHIFSQWNSHTNPADIYHTPERTLPQTIFKYVVLQSYLFWKQLNTTSNRAVYRHIRCWNSFPTFHTPQFNSDVDTAGSHSWQKFHSAKISRWKLLLKQGESGSSTLRSLIKR